MGNEKRCPFFRVPDSLNIGTGVGYCDLEGGWAICEGDLLYCEKPDALALCVDKALDTSHRANPSPAPRPSIGKAAIIQKGV